MLLTSHELRQFALGAVLMPLFIACTATEQTTELDAPSVGTGPVPTAVNSDADRRAIYESNGRTTGQQAIPDATPNTLRLGEEASGIDTKQRIGTLNTNDPNLTTPETDLQRIQYDAPPPEIHPQPTGTLRGDSPNGR